jgi:hypothetical protein
VNFIQTSKALQFGQISLTYQPLNTSAFVIQTVNAPSNIMWGMPFFLSVRLNPTIIGAESSRYSLLAFNNALTNQTTSLDFATNRESQAQLLVPPIFNSSRVEFLLIVVVNNGGKWAPASLPFKVEVNAIDGGQLSVNGLIENSTIILDQHPYVVPPDGVIQLTTTIGDHQLLTQQLVHAGNESYYFVQWNDGNTSNPRTLTVNGDIMLTALYRTEYFVNVLSSVGRAQGSGWYDVNSTLVPELEARAPTPYVFQYWAAGDSRYSTGDPIRVSGPMHVAAVWSESMPPGTPADCWLAISISMFAGLLLLNFRLNREQLSRRHRE